MTALQGLIVWLFRDGRRVPAAVRRERFGRRSCGYRWFFTRLDRTRPTPSHENLCSAKSVCRPWDKLCVPLHESACCGLSRRAAPITEVEPLRCAVVVCCCFTRRWRSPVYFRVRTDGVSGAAGGASDRSCLNHAHSSRTHSGIGCRDQQEWTLVNLNFCVCFKRALLRFVH